MKSKRWLWLLYSLPIIVSLALGIVMGAQSFSRSLELHSVQLLPANISLPNFSLETQAGEATGVEEFRGRWSLVFFGFTSCPDFCPMELQKLAKVLKLAAANADLQVIFVSVDPERDTLQKLAGYVGFFHPNIVGLRGENSELAGLAKFFGAAYDRSAVVQGKLLSIPAGIAVPAVAGSDYQVNHSTRVFLVNPQAEFIGSLSSPYSAEELWLDLQQLL
jgi:protein SCO1